MGKHTYKHPKFVRDESLSLKEKVDYEYQTSLFALYKEIPAEKTKEVLLALCSSIHSNSLTPFDANIDFDLLSIKIEKLFKDKTGDNRIKTTVSFPVQNEKLFLELCEKFISFNIIGITISPLTILPCYWNPSTSKCNCAYCSRDLSSKGVIYEYQCKCGQRYIGRTKTELRERINAQMSDISNRNVMKKHIVKCDFHLQLETVRILSFDSGDRLNNKEAVLLAKRQCKLNDRKEQAKDVNKFFKIMDDIVSATIVEKTNTQIVTVPELDNLKF